MGGKDDKRKVKPTSAAEPAGQDQEGPGARPSRSLYDWAYHGTGPVMSADDRAHILVEDVVFGTTERQDVAVMRELAEPVGGGFNWGYNGTGPLRAAAAILADALSLGDPADCGMDPFSPQPDATLIALRGRLHLGRDIPALRGMAAPPRRGPALGTRLVRRAQHHQPARGSCPAAAPQPLSARQRGQDRAPPVTSRHRIPAPGVS